MPVTVKGQVTVPKALRDHLGLTPGSRVAFVLEPDGRVVVRRADAAEATANDTRRSRFARTARAPGWGGMTTAEIMKLTRGEDWGEPG